MTKIQVTVPVFIGGKPFAVGDVAQVDEYEARLLIGMGRAVPHEERAPSIDSVVEDAGDDDGARKGARRTR